MHVVRAFLFVCAVMLLLAPGKAKGQEPRAYWLTRDTFNRFTDSMVVTGKIMKYSGLSPQCGVVCSSETFIFHLADTSAAYPYPDVYVAFTCEYKIENVLKKTLKLTLNKIALNDHSCFWEETFGTNPFDTKGLPFYELMSYSVVK